MSDRAGWVKAIDFASVPKTFDIAGAEAKWRAEWDARGLHRWDPTRPREETFVVDTPPPTVSGYLHIGHVFSYAHQDFIVRYRRMSGWNIFYPMGWDDNGLPTERRVQDYFHVRCDPRVPYDPELTLELPTRRLRRKPARVVSRRNFIEACHRVTEEDEQAFEELFRRADLSVDWREHYTTIDDLSRRMAQRSFIDIYEKGHAYQAEAPTMWDPEFQTAVAQAEVEDRERESAFYDIEFGVEGGGSFVISTTRPELLAACVGVTAHPDDERYRALFGKNAVTPIYHVPVPIFPSELADPELGTGILMVCSFGDQTDVQWWREQDLALRQVLGRDGRIVERTFGVEGWESLRPDDANRMYGEIVGRPVEAVQRIVAEQLRDPANSAMGGGAPLQGEPRPVVHAVRYYERSQRPLEFLTTRQWFVRLMDKKARLIEKGREIEWRPAYMGRRFEDWTENLGIDWCISRQRFFGVPFPVWYPLDDSGEPVYGEPILADPATLPVDPMSHAAPGYDESQRDAPGGFAGEPDVFDTWFTSSLSPQIAARWGEPDDRMSTLFPMDVRPQSHEIIRTWAFYTIAKAMLHEDDVPWRNVVISGWTLDPDRKKMSKSRGDAVTPVDLLDRYGADAVRYWSASARLGVDTAYDEQAFRVGKRLVTKIFNAGKFVLSQTAPEGDVTRELDRAFAGELREVVVKATAAYESYEFGQALQVTESFFWSSFADNFIELVKKRARDEEDLEGRASAVRALRLGLDVLLRLFAPVAPTITEEVWSWVFAEEKSRPSIHTAPWPTVDELVLPVPLRMQSGRTPTARGNMMQLIVGVGGPQQMGSFRAACEAIGAVRKAKTEAGIGLGRPLTRCVLSGPREMLDGVQPVLADVANAANAVDVVLRAVPVAEGEAGFTAEIERE